VDEFALAAQSLSAKALELSPAAYFPGGSASCKVLPRHFGGVRGCGRQAEIQVARPPGWSVEWPIRQEIWSRTPEATTWVN